MKRRLTAFSITSSKKKSSELLRSPLSGSFLKNQQKKISIAFTDLTHPDFQAKNPLKTHSFYELYKFRLL